MRQAVQEAGGLDCEVKEGGTNFSVGQRQLLCLARALLLEPRVLLMDECTASVEYVAWLSVWGVAAEHVQVERLTRPCVLCSHDTDNFIQQTVREHFRATLITIAHRLQTVTDYDKVLVMDKGRAVEYGAPVDLIQGDGLFATLVDAAGPQAALQLRADIEAAAKAKAQAASQS